MGFQPNAGRNMYESSEPRFPQFENFNDRLLTFGPNWPNHTVSTPEEFAEAGFFYLGSRDRVKCFYCNGGLLKWDRDDDPWFEHAKWYPTCGFVIHRRGMQFVQDVLQTAPGGSSSSRVQAQRVGRHRRCRRNRSIRVAEPNTEGHLRTVLARIGNPDVVAIAILCIIVAFLFVMIGSNFY